MPITINHALTATTPDNTSYEIRPQRDWNAPHIASLNAQGSEIVGAFTNSNGVSFGLNSAGRVTASVVVAGGGAGISAGNNSQTNGVVIFQNSNNVSFGLDGAGNMTGSVAPSGIVVSASNAAAFVTEVVFANGNGLSFGLAGSTVTGAYSVPSVAGLLSALPVSAGAQSSNVTGLTFSNGNGISFGENNGVITGSISQSNQTVQFVGTGNTTQGSVGTFDARAMSIIGAGIVSVGFTNGQVVISAAGTGGAGGVAISAGTNLSTNGTVQFINSNGVSFGLNATGGITATVTPGAAAGIAAIQAGTQTQTTGTLNFINANGVSFGLSGSNSISASFSQAAQTVQPVAVSGSNGSSTFATLSVGALNGLTHYMSNGSLVGSYTVPSTAGLVSGINVSAGVSGGNQTGLVFSNVNGLSFGLSNNSITGSFSTQPLGSISAGTTKAALGQVVFANANNVSFGLNGSTITASANPLVNFSAGTQVNANSGLTFSNSNGISFGLNNGTITASILPGAAAGVGAAQAGTQTQTSGTLNFANSNGISFGMSANSQITAAYTVPSVAGLISGVSMSAGTQSTYGQNLLFSNSNGISFGLNNGTITAAIVGTQSNQTLGFYGLGNTTGTSNGTVDLRSVSLVGAGIVSVGYSAGQLIISSPASTGVTLLSAGLSGGNTAGVSGTVGNNFVLAGGANVTLSGATNSNGMTVSVIGASGGTGGGGGGGVNFGVSTQGNTAGATGTVSTGNVILVGSGPISLSQATGAAGSAATITINAPAVSTLFGVGGISIATAGNNISISYTGTGGGAGGAALSAAGSSQNSGTVVFSNSNGVSFGMNGGTITASITPSGGAQTGISSIVAAGTTFTAGQVSFVNANGLSFGVSGASGISASYTVPVQSAQTLSFGAGGNTTQVSAMTRDARSMSLAGFGGVSVGFSNSSINISGPVVSTLSGVGPITVSTAGSTIFVGAPGTTQSVWLPAGGGPQSAMQLGNGVVAVFPLLADANYVASRVDMYGSFSLSTGAFSFGGTLSAAVGIYTRNGSTLSLASSGSQSYAFTNTSNVSLAQLQGIHNISMPIAVTIQQQDYWVAVMSQTASVGSNLLSGSNMVYSNIPGAYAGLFGATSAGSNQSVLGQGIFSATSAALPTSIAFSAINGTAQSALASPALAFHAVTA